MELNFLNKSPKVTIYLIVVLIISLVLAFFGLSFTLFLFLGLSSIYLGHIIKVLTEEKRLNDNNIENLSININNNIRENIFNLIYPICMLNLNGDIIWYNKSFEKLFAINDAKGSNLVSVVRGVALDKVLKCDKKQYQRIKVKKSIYEVYGKMVIQDNSTHFCMVHFNDVTYLSEKTKESIILIEVDNLSEVVKSTDENIRPLLVAEVERTLNNYASSIDAMIKKYDYGKYILSVDDNVIENEMKKKFDILDKIRDINFGNEIEVTLSIGIGRGRNTPAKNYDDAARAKELALGRGGDQAVVKSEKEISFFGGNTKEIEKRTKVRARVVARALKELVYESSKVYIMGHKNPDMDCFGAALGIASVVKGLGKNVKIVLDDNINAIDIFLEKISNKKEYDDLFISPKNAKITIDSNTLLILVDVHNKGYVMDNEIVELSNKVVIIDHHRRSPDIIEGAMLTYLEVYASSTSELVTEMVQYMLDKPKISKLEAEGLLAGIYMDTKNFTFKTGVRTFEAASFLRKLGADTIDIKKMFSNNLESYITKAEIIKSAKVEDNIAIAICPPSVKDTVTAAQAADELLNITGIKASFVFVIIDDSICISGRSFGDINVQVILESLNGGGHMTMAGTRLKGVSLEDALTMLKKSIKENLREGEQ
ncbi:MAG: DHH family phosphoesterase [Clostridium perfringens]|nr:DHH family phosphoesterase [Clostridium perfringens]